MNKKTWTSLVLVIIVGLTSIAIYTNYKAQKIEVEPQRDQAIEDLVERPKITISAKHQYRDGIHTYIGTFDTPTPCNPYNAKIRTEDNNNNIISITYSDPSPDEICAQVITERNFRVSFEGNEDINTVATINGELVNLNIFEVPENQNIKDFEIFTKG